MTLSYNTNVIIIACVSIPIGTLAVVMRFLARAKTHQKYQAEDWFSLVALVGFLVFQSLVLHNIHMLGEKTLYQIHPDTLTSYLKYLIAAMIACPISFAAAKFSILFLYMRVFGVNRHFSLGVKIVGVLNLLWMLASVLSLIFQCTPVRRAWNPMLPGTCFNLSTFTVAVEVPNSLLDFVMMALPISMLRKLKMRLRDKIVIGITFLLAGAVGIIGFVRIAITYHPHYNPKNTAPWMAIQLLMGVVCCCLPTYRPLFHNVKFLDSLRSGFTSLVRGTDRSKNSSITGENDISLTRGYFRQADGGYKLDDHTPERSVSTHVEGTVGRDTRSGEEHTNDKSLYTKGISVQKTVEIV